MDGKSIPLRVVDVRQWHYCARVPYFSYVFPVSTRPSAKMEHGHRQHEIVQALEKRRLLKRYGLERAERLFDLYLVSPKRGLSGIVDMALRDGSFCYPVEFKHSRRDLFVNQKMQLTAYAVLLEDALGLTAPSGFIHNTHSKRTVKVEIAAEMRAALDRTLNLIREMIQSEQMPEPTAQRTKCVDCEFRLWCGDVL